MGAINLKLGSAVLQPGQVIVMENGRQNHSKQGRRTNLGKLVLDGIFKMQEADPEGRMDKKLFFLELFYPESWRFNPFNYICKFHSWR